MKRSTVLYGTAALLMAAALLCPDYRAQEAPAVEPPKIEEGTMIHEVINLSSTWDYEEPVIEVKEPPVIEETPTIDPILREQLAILIYREAGGDACCDTCRHRIADVALNRVSDPRFPGTLEAVLTQKHQYGRMYWEGVTWPARASQENEKEAVDRAYRVAEEVLSGAHSDLYDKGYIFQSEFPKLGDDAGRIHCPQCDMYFAKG